MKKAGASPRTVKGKKDSQPKQSQRFVETAKALECDETGTLFERGMAAISPKSPKPKK